MFLQLLYWVALVVSGLSFLMVAGLMSEFLQAGRNAARAVS